MRGKLSGGLGVPNFAKYYQATQLAQIMLYHANNKSPLWIGLKAIAVDPVTIDNLHQLRRLEQKFVRSPVILQLKDPFQLISTLLLHILLWGPFLQLYTDTNVFHLWRHLHLKKTFAIWL